MRNTHGLWRAAGIVAVGLGLVAGCASQNHGSDSACAASKGCGKPIVVWSDPVTDEMLQTPSTTYVANTGVQAQVSHRDWPASTTYYEPHGTKHGPLYFEDPFETVEKSVPDGPEAWTWADFADIAYSDGRWLLNTVALPVSMVVNPPWQDTCSDGVPSRQLEGKVDATPCKGKIAEPFDLKTPAQQTAALAAVGQITTDAPASQPVK